MKTSLPIWGVCMQPIDGSYLYNIGKAVRPLSDLDEKSVLASSWLYLYVAHSELSTFIDHSVYVHVIRQSRERATELIVLLKELSDKAAKEEHKTDLLGQWDAYRLHQAVSAFETVIAAEFRVTPIFLITPKRGYDLNVLLSTGHTMFPDDFSTKIPEAALDAVLGARCLALEMPTAAAFHFHRVNEAVLRKYWDALRPGKPHPGNKTIGDYLRALGQARKGSTKVKATLRDIKDLYRNPVLHPEYHLENVDEAIALFNSVHTAVVLMLKVIPFPASASLPSAGSA